MWAGLCWGGRRKEEYPTMSWMWMSWAVQVVSDIKTHQQLPVFVSHRLTPVSGHSGIASGTCTLYYFCIIINVFLFVAFQSEKANWPHWVWPYTGHYCRATQTESFCFGDNDLVGAGERSSSVQCREWTPGTEHEVLQGRWWFLQGKVKFCFDPILSNGCLWVF